MLNFKSNGNVSLNPNLINEATIYSNESRISSTFPGQIPKINLSINKQLLKYRIKNVNPKNKK